VYFLLLFTLLFIYTYFIYILCLLSASLLTFILLCILLLLPITAEYLHLEVDKSVPREVMCAVAFHDHVLFFRVTHQSLSQFV
jgi:hypothetical protein